MGDPFTGTVRERAGMRRQALLDLLRRRPLSSAPELADMLLEETGGAPTWFTGAIYVPHHRALADLYRLEAEGKVVRYQTPGTRAISWQATEARKS